VTRVGAAAAMLLATLGAVPRDLPFVFWFSSRGVDVEIARPPAGPPWLRSRGEIPVAASRVAAVLSDFAHYRELLSPAVRKAEVVERDRSSVRIHFVWPYPFPYANRDAVVRYEMEEIEGGYRLSWKSESKPGDPKEGTRIERVSGETRIEPAGADACWMTYTYLGDLGGKFPAWAQEKAWREESVQYFRAIRRKLGLPDEPK
jgi:polyketide cyclase/dehydrase/lipid transport protein